MITNERQYFNTQAAVRRFEKDLKNLARNASLEPWTQEGIRLGIESEVARLRTQLTRYEELRSGNVREFEVEVLEELPDLLILARIVQGLTQKELAEELGVKEQQIQKYEATRYMKAAFERLVDAAVVLGLKVHVQATVAEDSAVSEAPVEVSAPPSQFVQQEMPFLVQLRGGSGKKDAAQGTPLQQPARQQLRLISNQVGAVTGAVSSSVA